jgi:hypothetical protein
MAVRKWHLGQALESFARLNEIITELTEDEVLAALELEAASRRRRSMIDRLISRAVRLNEMNYVANLKEKYHGTPTVKSPVSRRAEGAEAEPESRHEGARRGDQEG